MGSGAEDTFDENPCSSSGASRMSRLRPPRRRLPILAVCRCRAESWDRARSASAMQLPTLALRTHLAHVKDNSDDSWICVLPDWT